MDRSSPSGVEEGPMNILFTAHDLLFEAEVNIGGYYYPATRWEPAEYPEIEILSLRCNGADAGFLLDSVDLAEDIQIAAECAVEKERRAALEELDMDKYLATQD